MLNISGSRIKRNYIVLSRARFCFPLLGYGKGRPSCCLRGRGDVGDGNDDGDDDGDDDDGVEDDGLGGDDDFDDDSGDDSDNKNNTTTELTTTSTYSIHHCSVNSFHGKFIICHYSLTKK